MIDLFRMFGMKLSSPRRISNRIPDERGEDMVEFERNTPQSIFGKEYHWEDKGERIYELSTNLIFPDGEIDRDQEIVARLKHDPLKLFCMDEEMKDAYAKPDGMPMDAQLSVIIPNQCSGDDEILRAYFRSGRMQYEGWRMPRATDFESQKKFQVYDNHETFNKRLASFFGMKKAQVGDLVRKSDLPRDYKNSVRDLWRR